MAKAKFERTNHIVILVQSVKRPSKTTLTAAITKFCLKKLKITQLLISRTSIKLQKKESVVSQFLQLTLSMRQQNVTMHTLTAQDMLTTLKT